MKFAFFVAEMMCRRRTFLFVVFVGVVGVCRGQQDPSPKHVLTSVPGFEGFSEQAYSVSMVEQARDKLIMKRICLKFAGLNVSE